MGEVERRWADHFFRAVEPDEQEKFEAAFRLRVSVSSEVEAEIRANLHRLLLGAHVRVKSKDHQRKLLLLKFTLNDIGLEVSGGPWPKVGHKMKLLGVLADGVPRGTWEKSVWIPAVAVLHSSLFVEALPLDFDVRLLDRALELLPELPEWDYPGRPPLYHEPLRGPWAEWVDGARAMLEMADLVEANDAQPGKAA